jgi:molybdate transport repressor ModE-like protein
MPDLKTRNLAALQVFLAVTRAGSLSAAARELGISTASVSGTLKDLEREFGMPLVARSANQTLPTPAGEALRERATSIVRELEALRETARGKSAGMSGSLRIYTRVPSGFCFVVPLLSRFRRAHPDVTFELVMTDDRIKLSELGIDIAIVDELPEVTTPVSRRLLTSARILCASPAYLRRAGVPSQPAELGAHQCITSVVSRGEPVWRFRRAGTIESVHPPAVVQTTDWQALVRLALQGNGLVMVPARYVQGELAAGELVQVLANHDCAPGASADFRENLWVLYQKTRHRSPKVRAFVDMLVAFVEADARPG